MIGVFYSLFGRLSPMRTVELLYDSISIVISYTHLCMMNHNINEFEQKYNSSYLVMLAIMHTGGPFCYGVHRILNHLDGFRDPSLLADFWTRHTECADKRFWHVRSTHYKAINASWTKVEYNDTHTNLL